MTGCNCYSRVNDALEPKNTRIKQMFVLDDNREGMPWPIETTQVETGRGKAKACSLIASFCPFCGVSLRKMAATEDSPKGVTAACDVEAAALRRALAEYPGRNTHQLQARKICAGVLALAKSYGSQTQDSHKGSSDTARLDSGMIRLSHRDEFGEDGHILHTGVNLRAAIDAAMQAQASDAEVRRCRTCGCTDTRACPGGCWWVEADLCSACAPQAGGAHG